MMGMIKLLDIRGFIQTKQRGTVINTVQEHQAENVKADIKYILYFVAIVCALNFVFRIYRLWHKHFKAKIYSECIV